MLSNDVYRLHLQKKGRNVNFEENELQEAFLLLD